MAVVPVAFAITSQDLKVISAMCDAALLIFGAEKDGSYTVAVRFSDKSVSMSVTNANNYKSPKEKVLNFVDGYKLPKFFKKAGEYWIKRDEGPNVVLVDVVYCDCPETGRRIRKFPKMDFFKVDNIEIHKLAEVIPPDLVV